MGYSVEDRLAQLEEENRRLRAAVEALDASMPRNAPESQSSRRDLLKKALAVGAGAVAATALVPPTEADATTGAMQFGAVNDAGVDTTALKTSAGTTLQLENSSATHNSGPGVVAYLCEGSGYALYCYSVNNASSPTILANAYGQAYAIQGQQFNDTTAAAAVVGSNSTGGSGPGVHGSSSGGPGVRADGKPGVFATSNSGAAIRGEVAGSSGSVLDAEMLNYDNTDPVASLVSRGTTAVLARITSTPGSSQPSIDASTVGNGPAVRGSSATGRGAVFSSASTAQLRLLPSASATHPLSGKRGDLFVDKSGRLWFCKGNTNWKQLA
jgi:hypothetical protein